jgi:PRTRC genetic system ThiF family protein
MSKAALNHRLKAPAWVTKSHQPIPTALVGCGGSGSLMLMRLLKLHQALVAHGRPGLHVTVYDPDLVSPANVGRQAFWASDVGHNKAEVLVTRINAFAGLNWRAVPCRFPKNALPPADADTMHLLVSCVDSKEARVAIGDCLLRYPRRYERESLLWLDLGNDAEFGQAVLGEPLRHKQPDERYRLPTVLELFPAMRTDPPAANTPSCSLAEAITRQDLYVNEMLVAAAANLLWQVFRQGELSTSAVFVNCRTQTMTPLPINADAWRRFGHVTHRYGKPERLLA